jgi:cell division protein FtsB
MIILAILCVILASVAGYFIYRAYVLAGLLADQLDYTDEVEQLSEYMYRMIDEAHRNMKRIDRLGAFEKEDEAGTTFQLLKEVIDNLNEEFNGTQEEEK